MRSNKSLPSNKPTYNERNIAKLMQCAKYGLLKPSSPYLDNAIKTGKYTIEEIEEARRRYELTLRETSGFFSTVNISEFIANIFTIEHAEPQEVIVKEQMKLNIKSIDFDGCLFNKKYLQSKADNRLIDANSEFIRGVAEKTTAEKYDAVEFMIGSNRQSLAIDKVNNQDGRGSCFPAIKVICEAFQQHLDMTPCRVNPYLLADTYGKNIAGENFRKAIEKDRFYHYSDWLFDDSKVTLIYAQIHYVSSENPQAKLVYDFYDDRSDILNSLMRFFSENSDLLPNNLTMRLHQYAGNGIKNIGVIDGEACGVIDFHYQEHINLMIHCAELSFHRDIEKTNNVLKGLVGDKLLKFKNQRCIKMQDIDNAETYYSQSSQDENCRMM